MASVFFSSTSPASNAFRFKFDQVVELVKARGLVLVPSLYVYFSVGQASGLDDLGSPHPQFLSTELPPSSTCLAPLWTVAGTTWHSVPGIVPGIAADINCW